MAKQDEVAGRFPVVTLSVAVLAGIVYWSPSLRELLVYDREAVLGGAVWRLFTAPFVHFSASHIFWDVLVFGAAGCLIETAGCRRFWLLCAAVAILPGPLLFLFSDLGRYGGLSGLSTGAASYLCLCRSQADGEKGKIWHAILVLILLKTAVELAVQEPLFAEADRIPFRVLPLAHIVGLLTASFLFFYDRLGERLALTNDGGTESG